MDSNKKEIIFCASMLAVVVVFCAICVSASMRSGDNTEEERATATKAITAADSASAASPAYSDSEAFCSDGNERGIDNKKEEDGDGHAAGRNDDSYAVKVNPYYDEGYENGYDDGILDGNDNMREQSYDARCRYRGRQRREYEEGYDEGYEAGFDDGYADSGGDPDDEE